MAKDSRDSSWALGLRKTMRLFSKFDYRAYYHYFAIIFCNGRYKKGTKERPVARYHEGLQNSKRESDYREQVKDG